MTNIHGGKMSEIMSRMKNINYWSLIPGMTPGEVCLLGAICENNGEKKKISDLYGVCNMQPTAVSRLLNSLEDKALIVRTTRKDNRRVIDVCATENGIIKNKENSDIIHGYWSRVMEKVPEEDVKTMLNVLDEIMDSMESVLLQIQREEEKTD